jgi:hypothetical protein
LFNLTLAGLPELELFPCTESRQTALWEISNEVSRPRARDFWLGVAILAGSAAAAFLAVRWLMAVVQWPALIERSLPVAAVIVAFAWVLRRLHRRGMQQALREKLLARGIPVCRSCGYLLHGLALEPGRCPECGRPFDEIVRSILEGE